MTTKSTLSSLSRGGWSILSARMLYGMMEVLDDADTTEPYVRTNSRCPSARMRKRKLRQDLHAFEQQTGVRDTCTCGRELSDPVHGEFWTPTSKNINALPVPIRRYIH